MILLSVLIDIVVSCKPRSYETAAEHDDETDLLLSDLLQWKYLLLIRKRKY